MANLTKDSRADQMFPRFLASLKLRAITSYKKKKKNPIFVCEKLYRNYS